MIRSGGFFMTAPPAGDVTGLTLTTGTLTLLSTFNCISVRANYTGDDAAVGSATIQFKRSIDSTWKTAYPPIVDRRSTVNGVDNSANRKQARGSIVGLTADTAYDVRVTWSSSNGISGSNPVTGSISTLTYSPPASGATLHVGSGQTYATIPDAISAMNNGDTIEVHAGSYAALTLSVSGAPSAYRVLRVHAGDTVTITGDTSTNTSKTLIISANYWRIIGFTIGASGGSSIAFTDGVHHIYVEDCSGTDVAIGTHPTDGSDQAYYGVFDLQGTYNNIFLLRNNFTSGRTVGHDGPFIDGVILAVITTLVIDACIFTGNASTGGFWDSIGNGTNLYNVNFENVDVSNNTLTEYADDPVEFDGAGINCRGWGNICTTTANIAGAGAVAMSLAPILVGPTYLFRNLMYPAASPTIGLKQSGDISLIVLFIFHNVVDTTDAPPLGVGGHEASNAGIWTQYRNNIFKANGAIRYGSSSNIDTDYNLGYSTSGGNYASAWDFTTNYASLADFQAGTGQESHGLYGDPLFIDSARHIDSSSPAYNSGVILPNFNDADSAWPYSGVAPDMGAFEV